MRHNPAGGLSQRRVAYRLVDVLQVLRDVEALHAPLRRNQLVLHLAIPQTTRSEVLEQVRVDLFHRCRE